MSDRPRLAELIVHDTPMILIDELVDVGENDVHCRVAIHESGLFFDPKARTVPGYIGMEFMAQTVAVWSGYHAWKRNETPAIGFLLGGRVYESERSDFLEGMVLDIRAKQIMQSENMAVFLCTIQYNDVLIAKCELNVYHPPSESWNESN